MRKSTFFGIPVRRIPTTSRPWLAISDLGKALGKSNNAVLKRAAAHPLAPFRTVVTGSLVKHNRTLSIDIEMFLALIFTEKTEQARPFREAVIRVLSNLANDGFVSDRNYHLPVDYRRAITAYVCGVNHYLDIVRERWDRDSDSYGSSLSPLECSVDKLCIPDYFLNRSEITQIKAIDLAIYLLVSTCGTSEPTDDTTASMYEKLFDIIGVDLQSGQQTAHQEQALADYVQSQLGVTT